MKKILSFLLVFMLIGGAVYYFYPFGYEYFQKTERERELEHLNAIKQTLVDFIEEEKEEIDDLNALTDPNIAQLLTNIDAKLLTYNAKQLEDYYDQLQQLVSLSKKDKALAVLQPKLDAWLTLQKDIANGVLNQNGEPNTDNFPNIDYYEYLAFDKLEVVDHESINIYTNDVFKGYPQAFREISVKLVQHATSDILFDNKKIFRVTVYNTKKRIIATSQKDNPIKIEWR